MADEVRLNPPFRAEHIGSLLRPRELKDAFRAYGEGRLDERAFREVQDRCIRDAIRMQGEIGLETVTDGEFRRSSWSFGFVKALEGFIEKPSRFEFRDAEGNKQRWDTCYAAQKIRRTHGITTGEFAFVRAHTKATPKVTMPAPSFLHFFRGRDCADAAVYPELADFWSDLIAIYREELSELGRMGASWVQLDEVPLAMLCDEGIREKIRALGEDPASLSATYIDAVNRVLKDRPAGMAIGMHLCRGNLRGRWMAAGSYEAIGERLFNDLRVDGFLLEYDTVRAGDFTPLRFIPPGKFVVLGLVSTKTAALEDKGALKRRIDEASRYVALERLAISPQCGFASTVGGNPLSLDDERAKLSLVVELAREVWG